MLGAALRDGSAARLLLLLTVLVACSLRLSGSVSACPQPKAGPQRASEAKQAAVNPPNGLVCVCAHVCGPHTSLCSPPSHRPSHC